MKTKYQTLHAQLVHACDQMLSILDKANISIEKNLISEEELLQTRIAPDMFHFAKQVHIFCDVAGGSMARLTHTEMPKNDAEEDSLSDLIGRVEITKQFISSINKESLETADTLQIHMGWMPENMYFDGDEYAEKYVLQNSIFHIVTVYNILRMKGVDIGKADYISQMEMKIKE
jgi:uncharacterized protein